jgi:hypothetical protein
MKSIAIGTVTEADVDEIVRRAGGRCNNIRRGSAEPTHADYVFDDAVIELKCIVEEGFSKSERQAKLAKLFENHNNPRPVVILNPELLSDGQKRAYYNALLTPIQKHVKKAAAQTTATVAEVGGDHARVLLILNVGYTGVDHTEFTRLVLKSARNDTSKIDVVVVGGIYHYGDGFDSLIVCPLDMWPINVNRVFRNFPALKREWNALCEQMVTSAMLGTSTVPLDKLPIVDLTYEFDDITYVKPAPKMGKPSQFWVSGRPRSNSSGIETCPPVGVAFPTFDLVSWEEFRRGIRSSGFLKEDYSLWREFAAEEQRKERATEEPLVPVRIKFGAFGSWCRAKRRRLDDQSLFDYAVEQFDKEVRDRMFSALDLTGKAVVPVRHVHLIVEEIGQDRAHDLSSAYLLRERDQRTTGLPLFEHRRMFFEHALAVASAYAVMHDVPIVTYVRDKSYAWS